MFTSGEKIMLPCPPPRPAVMDRRWKATVELAPNCPRCDSSNTKFCYYNNYSLTQPRYFCKVCRRYWTKGGSLRNVPVGGGCRKNRRGKSVRISTDRVTMGNSNYGRLVPEPDPVGNLNQLRNGSDVLSTSDSSTIDLAAVYAKFLNQRPTDSDSGIAAVPELILNEFDVVSSLDDLPNVHLEPPNHHGPSQFLEVEHNDHMVLECLHPALHDHPINPEAHIGEGQQSFLGGREFVVNEKHDQVPDMDKDGFGLQPQLPADQGVVHDIDWCQLPNFMWQSSQSTQTQELGISFPEDHLNLHSSLLNGNWSSFSQVFPHLP